MKKSELKQLIKEEMDSHKKASSWRVSKNGQALIAIYDNERKAEHAEYYMSRLGARQSSINKKEVVIPFDKILDKVINQYTHD